MDIQADVCLSNRGFYLKVQELIEYGLVFIVNDVVDKRRRCLHVTEAAKAIIELPIDAHHDVTQDRGLHGETTFTP